MIDALITFAFAIFFVVCILIFTAFDMLTVPVMVTLIISIGLLLVYSVIGVLLRPRPPARDPWADADGDVPKVPHGR